MIFQKLVPLLLSATALFVVPATSQNVPIVGPWRALPGSVKHIAAGAEVYGTGQNHEFYRVVYNSGGDTSTWTNYPGTGKRLAAGDAGIVYMIGTNKELYKGNGSGQWVNLGAGNQVVDVGANLDQYSSTQYCYTVEGNGAGGGPIYCDYNGAHYQIPGEKVKVDVQSNGLPIGVNKVGHMYRAYGEMPDNVWWHYLGTGYIDCAVGPDGKIWGIKSDNTIVYDVGGDERYVGGRAVEIAVDINNKAWLLGTDHSTLFEYTSISSRRYRYEKNTIETYFQWSANGYKWCVENALQIPYFDQTPRDFNTGFGKEAREYRKLVHDGPGTSTEQPVSCMERWDIISDQHDGIWQCSYYRTVDNMNLYKC